MSAQAVVAELSDAPPTLEVGDIQAIDLRPRFVDWMFVERHRCSPKHTHLNTTLSIRRA
jgi:hypothetical protein